MTAIDSIIADARAAAQAEGLTSDQVLALWLLESFRSASAGYVRATPAKRVPLRLDTAGAAL